MESVQLRSSIRNSVRAERVSRREDWFLGPLAPRRDAGKKGKDVGVVGTEMYLERDGEKERKREKKRFGRALGEGKGRGKEKEREKLGEGKEGLRRRWCGWEECLVEVGDRVVIVGKGGTEEMDRGMIGEVLEVRKVAGEVVVEGLNKVSLRDLLLVVYRFLRGKELGVSRGFLEALAFNLL